MDFLALVNAKLKDKKVTIEDSCLSSARPIRILFENGRVKEVRSPAARVFVGGG